MTPHVLLVPGAWSGAWNWQPTVDRLRAAGVPASTITLAGVDGAAPDRAAAVRLADHVREVREAVEAISAPVLLVSHSYSAMVTGQVADQIPDRITRLVHVGGFLPADGRSLLDAWGETAADREQEARDIAAAGNLWLPPTRAMLEWEPDLTDADRDELASRFTPHPGSTITDPATMSAPVTSQPTTYVALSPSGEADAWENAPAAAREAPQWRRAALRSGHWPMVSQPDAVVQLLLDEARAA